MTHKLTYWIAECLNDSDCYSIRAKTRKEVIGWLNNGTYKPGDFGPPKKVTVEYADAFDLMEKCMTEGRGYWEA